MRPSAFAFGFLALRSRPSVRLTGCQPVRGAVVQQQHASRRHVLLVDPASPCNDLESGGYQVTVRHGISDTELEEVLPSFDAVVVRSANRITRRMLVASPRVAIVGRAGSGVDNIDLQAASELGVPVVNAPTGNAGSVAELVLGLLLGLSRSIPSAHETMRRGEWAKKDFTGRTLNGKILGIVGFGSVGRAVTRLAVAFGMVVLLAEGFRLLSDPGGDPEKRSPPPRRETDAKELGVILPPLPLHELLSKVDFLSVHCPLTADTMGLVSERELALMKPSAVVINAARGGVVDEKALLHALEEGRLGGAALDVFTSEKAPTEAHVTTICRLPNVLCTPHIGGSTEEAGERVLSEVCGAVMDFFEGTLPPSKIVNGDPDMELRLTRVRNSL